tara:strand:+ start:6445 stop:7194 length:750 start_codon:yes stop_codon:yes gene_type:complete
LKALLLAAGYGTRLDPITKVIPKCMVPIKGRPLLDIWIESLLEGGITQVLINTHYKNEIVEEFISNSSWKDLVVLVHEDKLLGTGSTILKNETFFCEDTFLVAHADNLTDLIISNLIDSHAKVDQDILATMLLFNTPKPEACGVVKLKGGLVTEFFEKKLTDNGNLANGAVYIFNRTVFNILRDIKKESIDISLDLIPLILGKINSHIHEGYFQDIGDINNWVEANLYFKEQKMKKQNVEAWKLALKGE